MVATASFLVRFQRGFDFLIGEGVGNKKERRKGEEFELERELLRCANCRSDVISEYQEGLQ